MGTRYCKHCGREWTEFPTDADYCGACGDKLPPLLMATEQAKFRKAGLNAVAKDWLEKHPPASTWKGSPEDWCYWRMPFYNIESRGLCLAELDLLTLGEIVTSIFGPGATITIDSEETRIYADDVTPPIILRRARPIETRAHYTPELEEDE